jgi:hypothetical protein
MNDQSTGKWFELVLNWYTPTPLGVEPVNQLGENQ